MRKRLFLCSDRQLRHFRQVGGVRQRPLVHQGQVGVRVLHVLLLLSLVVEMLLLILRLRRNRWRRHGARGAVQERVGGGEG